MQVGVHLRLQYGAEFRANENAGAFHAILVLNRALRANEMSGPALDDGEIDPVFLIRLLTPDFWRFCRILPANSFRQAALSKGVRAVSGIGHFDQIIIIGSDDAMWRQAFNRERPGYEDSRFIFMGAII